MVCFEFLFALVALVRSFVASKNRVKSKAFMHLFVFTNISLYSRASPSVIAGGTHNLKVTVISSQVLNLNLRDMNSSMFKFSIPLVMDSTFLF